MNSKYDVVQVDYHNSLHTDAILELLAEYANDPAIGRPGLGAEVRGRLISEMAKRPTVVAILAFAQSETSDKIAVGAVICIESFSSFSAKSVINIHDLLVGERYRGQGVGRRLLEAVETLARQRECAKITLEVLEQNQAACRLYRRFGFAAPEAREELGKTLFLNKRVDDC